MKLPTQHVDNGDFTVAAFLVVELPITNSHSWLVQNGRVTFDCTLFFFIHAVFPRPKLGYVCGMDLKTCFMPYFDPTEEDGLTQQQQYRFSKAIHQKLL